jgi:hypothetical protein
VVGGIGAGLRRPDELGKLWAVSEQEIGAVFDVPTLVRA